MNYRLMASRLRLIADKLDGDHWFQNLQRAFPANVSRVTHFSDSEEVAFCSFQTGKQILRECATLLADYDKEIYPEDPVTPEDYMDESFLLQKSMGYSQGFSPLNLFLNESDKYMMIYGYGDSLTFRSFSTKEELQSNLSYLEEKTQKQILNQM